MLLGHSAEEIARARALATQAREPVPHYEHAQIGRNHRLSNIAAAIGRGQLTVLDERVARRRAIFDHYVTRPGGLGTLADAVPEGLLEQGQAHGNVSDMKTTIDLPDDLLIAAKKRAAELKCSLRTLIERGLRQELSGPRRATRGTKRRIRWVTVPGGLPPSLDVRDRASMHEWLRRQE